MNLALWLIIASLIAAHIVGFRFDIKSKNNIEILRSFAAGFSIGYVFLVLLPEIFRIRSEVRLEVMYLALLGFVFFHLTHKFIYKVRDKSEQVFLLDEVHLMTSAVYNFLIAFFLVEITRLDQTKGLIIALLLIVHTILVDLSHAELTQSHKVKFKLPIIMLATLAGGIISIFNLTSPFITMVFFSITAGAIIYISIREEIPEERSGRGSYFIAGVLTLITLTLLLL